MKQESVVEYFWRAWWWSSETRDRRGLDALVRCGMESYNLAMSALFSTEALMISVIAMKLANKALILETC